MRTWLTLVVAVLALGGTWAAWWLLKWSLLTPLIISGVVIVGAFVVWLICTLIVLRRAKGIERGVLSGGGNAPEQAAMRDQFSQYLTALKTSPSGKGALATLPWFLVLGAPGSGKTTLLQESGLAFSSLGHGLRSIRGIGGTRNCDWWFSDRAIFLDTAGRYTTQPEDQDEWLSFLDLIKRNRAGLPVNGIMIVLAVPDVLRDNGAHIPELIRPLRERVIEVSTRLGVVLPVYIVFTKADLLGGFKDFFAAMPRAQRQQVWGFSFSDADRAKATVEDLYQQQSDALMAALTAKRMAALMGERPAKELGKAVAFPGNFRQVQARFRSCVAELFQPFPLGDQPLLRGVYFTSALPPMKSGPQGPILPVPTAQNLDPSAPHPGSDVSIFFQAALPAGPKITTDDGRSGFFLGELFSQIILGDGGIAGRPVGARKLQMAFRALLSYGSIAAGLLLCLWLVLGALGDRALALSVGDAGFKLSAARASGNEGDEAQALDDLRRALVAVEEQATPWRRAGIAAVGQRVYFPVLTQRFLQPAGRTLASELNAGLDRLGKDGSFRDLFALFSAYQQLAGIYPPDRELLARALVENPRLAGGSSAPEARVLESGRHLDYLVQVMPKVEGWKIEPDRALLDRVRAALGDNVWIQEGYGELIASVQSGNNRIGRDELVGGDGADLLESGFPFSGAYTAEAWRQEVEPAIGEKAEALAERIARLGRKQLSASEIRRRLRTLYARDFQANWLRAVAELRPSGFASLSEAAARLQTLTGLNSPYKRLPRALTQAQVDFGDVDSAGRLPTSDAWIAEGLAAAQELQAAVQRFVAGTESGARGRDLRKVEEFCGILDALAGRFAEAGNKLDDPDGRRAATSCLQNLIAGVHKGLLAELSTEIERTWTDTVRKPFADQCVGKYPFDPAAKAEVDLRAFSALFNPKSGGFWRAVAGVEALRKMKIMGHELLPASVEYQRVLAQAQTLRGALFGGDAEEMTIPFTLTLQQREAVENQVFSIGAQRFGLYDRPDRRMRFEWKQSSPGGAKITITVAKDDYTRDESSPGWGILRLLRSGVPQKRPDAGYQLTWGFISQKLGKTYFAAAVLEASDLELLIAGDLLKTFTLPDRIVR